VFQFSTFPLRCMFAVEISLSDNLVHDRRGISSHKSFVCRQATGCASIYNLLGVCSRCFCWCEIQNWYKNLMASSISPIGAVFNVERFVTSTTCFQLFLRPHFIAYNRCLCMLKSLRQCGCGWKLAQLNSTVPTF